MALHLLVEGGKVRFNIREKFSSGSVTKSRDWDSCELRWRRTSNFPSAQRLMHVLPRPYPTIPAI
eukprot:scaffold34924_cov125-Amphora_coffeaeformis.AAC.3